MQIFVKCLAGRTIALNVQSTDSIESVKAQIAAIEGIPVEAQNLVTDKLLVEGCCLGEYGVQAESTINVVLAVDGGKKKKKKKKIFKNAKKKAHKHKNIKMRVLKYYKVEGDGEGAEYKVTHERTECPHPDCGAGVFMAAHKDRQTCGKCSLTYVFQKK